MDGRLHIFKSSNPQILEYSVPQIIYTLHLSCAMPRNDGNVLRGQGFVAAVDECFLAGALCDFIPYFLAVGEQLALESPRAFNFCELVVQCGFFQHIYLHLITIPIKIKPGSLLN